MILINKCWWLPLALSCFWACGPKENSVADTETAFKPAEIYFAQRLSPQTQFPVEAYHTALRRLGTAVADRSPEPGFDAEWTTRGPINVGARINTIALDPIDTSVIYAGFSAGGIFKTTDGGQNWKPVFDHQAYLAIGDIAIHPKNNKIVFAGTGDPNISGYPFIGDGLFRSTDAGNTWQYQGLREGRIISKILIDPLRPDTMYVGCMGLPFERDRNRGMYKTTDGGKTWRQILFVDTQAGIIDAVMDPSNPQVIYAASWDRIRNNQESTVSGDHARIYKTSDGGRSWTVLSRGLPTGPQGRIGLTISPQHPNVLYAVYVGTNSELEGIYKTTDGGQDWERLPIESGPGFQPGALGGFGWYFGKIRVHPQDTGTVYLLGVELHRISDGGLQWRTLPDSFDGDMPHADKHDLVFTDEGKMLLATDGGLFKSKDGGSSWKDIENIPATQFYRVEYNPHEPAYYYGGAQDNGSLAGSQMEWRRMYGGGGFPNPFPPGGPHVFYAEYPNGGMNFAGQGNDLDRRHPRIKRRRPTALGYALCAGSF